MKMLDCDQVIDLAPELAVGNLYGEERAAAIDHLATCASCQEEVNALATVTDQLLRLATWAEPPAGFEQRVLAAISAERATPPTTAPPRRRRVARLLSAAALALSFAVGGLLLDLAGPSNPALARAEMRTASGAVVGQVVLHEDHPTWLLMTMPGWTEAARGYGPPGLTYSVHVDTDDGRQMTYPIAPSEGGSWSTSMDVAVDRVARVAIVDDAGHVWCEADF